MLVHLLDSLTHEVLPDLLVDKLDQNIMIHNLLHVAVGWDSKVLNEAISLLAV